MKNCLVLLIALCVSLNYVSANRSTEKLLQVADEVSIDFTKFLKHDTIKITETSERSYGNYTMYDKIFWVLLATFIVYVVYIRMRTNYRIDYPDEEASAFCSAIIRYRKSICPDPYLDPDVKKFQLMSEFTNGPLIMFYILWFSVGFSSLDEIFGVTFKHIEDIVGLLVALSVYFVNIIGCCIIFDICVTAPMKYYEKN